MFLLIILVLLLKEPSQLKIKGETTVKQKKSLVKVWDTTSKKCIATLSGHTENVSAVATHPLLPLIISAAEDGTLRLWHSRTFRLEAALDYGLGRVWALAAKPSRALVAAGFDFGAALLRLGDEAPVASMDRDGRAVWFQNYAVHAADLRLEDR